MTIGGITNASSGVQRGAGLNPQADSVSRSLQNQIAQAQKELRELSSDDSMTAEEKMKRKQEIQQEIANLNQQLRQHQMEQKREQQSARKAAEEGTKNGAGAKPGDAKPGKAKPAGKAEGLSQAGMQSMLSADASVKQARVQGRTVTGMEGRAGVLKAEIRQDAGGNTQAKEAELAETEQRALKAETSQMNTLARANREMKKVSETEQGSRAEEGGKEAGSKGNKVKTETGSRLDPTDRAGTAEGPGQGTEENDDRDDVQEALKKYAYVPIDIRL